MGWQSRPDHAVGAARTLGTTCREERASRRRERTDESIGRMFLTRASAVATRSNRPPRAVARFPLPPPGRTTGRNRPPPHRHFISSSSPADRTSNHRPSRASSAYSVLVYYYYCCFCCCCYNILSNGGRPSGGYRRPARHRFRSVRTARRRPTAAPFVPQSTVVHEYGRTRVYCH